MTIIKSKEKNNENLILFMIEIKFKDLIN